MAKPPNRDTIAAFITDLFRDADSDQWVTLFAARPDGSNKTLWSEVGQLDTVVDEAVELNTAGWHIYHGVATRRTKLDGGRRGGASDCAAITSLWVDIDVAGPNHPISNKPLAKTVDQALDVVHRYALPPTWVIDTGGGIHAYWLLQEPLGADDATHLLRKWGHTWIGHGEQAGVEVDPVWDLPRVMRTPGTLNWKTTPGAIASVLSNDDN